jgi:hypothetical protein
MCLYLTLDAATYWVPMFETCVTAGGVFIASTGLITSRSLFLIITNTGLITYTFSADHSVWNLMFQ